MRFTSLGSARTLIIILVLLLWVTSTLLTRQVKTFTIPLQVVGLSNGLAVAEPLSTVEVQLSGRLKDLARVGAPTVAAAVNLTSSVPGSTAHPVSISIGHLPVTLVGFSPAQVTLTLEHSESKSLPVSVVPDSWPSNGYNLTSLEASPSSVTVTGAPTLLAQLSEVRAHIALRGHRATFTAPAHFQVEDAHGQPLTVVNLTPSNGQVTATLTAGEYLRNLGIEPQFKGNLPAGYWIQEVDFDPPVVQVAGNRQTLDRLSALRSSVINLDGHTTSFTDQVSVELPASVHLVGENLVQVRLKIALLALDREASVVPSFSGLSDEFIVDSVDPPNIQAVISGDPAAVANFKPSDLKLNIDLTGAVSGPTTLRLTSAMFSLPPGLQVVSFTPSTLEVIISRK